MLSVGINLSLTGGQAGSVSSSIARAIATNRNMFPSNVLNTANYVRHSRIQFEVAANTNFTQIRAYFPGWGQNAGGEFASPDTQNVKSSIEYGGVIYPADFSSATNVDVTANGGAWMTFSGLNLTAGTSGVIVTRAVGATHTAVDRLIGHGTHAIFNEGGILGTDTGVDLTAGVYARNAVAAAPTIAGGNITACGVAQAGVNFSVGTNVYAYQVATDGTIKSKVIGYCNPSGGGVASISITDGTPPAGLAAWTAACVVVIGNAFSSTTAVYGPALITGQPSVAVKSLAIHGTSIDIGWGSTDSIGDLNRNFGLVERGLLNRCGALNLASPSQTYAGYSNATTFSKTYAFLSSLGSTITHSFLGAPSNDVQAGTAKATIEGQMNTVKTALIGYGHKVDFSKLLPRTTSSDSWATVVNQTEDTGFGSGGVGEGFNTDVAAGTMVSNGVGFIDGRTQMQDGTSTRKWDVVVDRTDDGIHPTLIALAAAAANTTYTNQFAGYA